MSTETKKTTKDWVKPCQQHIADLGLNYSISDWHRKRDLVAKELGINQNKAHEKLVKTIQYNGALNAAEVLKTKLKDVNESLKTLENEINS